MEHGLFLLDLLLLFGVHFGLTLPLSSLRLSQKMLLAWLGELAFVVTSAYLLSVFRLLGSPSAWLALHGIYFVILSLLIGIKILPNFPIHSEGWIDQALDTWADAPGWLRVLLVGYTAAVLLLIAGNVLRPLPFNDDALGYHLPRVERYIEQNSLLAYPTGDRRQTDFPLNYELWMVWALVFTRDIRWMYGIQWGALAFAAMGLFTACRSLRLERVTALAVSWLWLATPYLLLQSAFIKNDGMLACLAACLIPFLIQPGVAAAPTLAVLGLGLGLMAGMKYTALFFLPGAACLWIVSLLPHFFSWRKWVYSVLLFGLPLCLLGCYAYIDTWLRTGSPIAAYEGGGEFRLRSFPANTTRLIVELTDSLALPNELAWRISREEVFDIRAPILHFLHRYTYLDVFDAPSFWPWIQPEETFNPSDRYFQYTLGHFALLFLGILASLRRLGNWGTWAIWILFGIGFVLQSSMLLWQPIDNLRFYFPLLTLLYPLMGYYLEPRMNGTNILFIFILATIFIGMSAILYYLIFQVGF